MCGIAGIFGQANEGLAREFCGVLEHRGPDDQGCFVSAENGAVTLASRRLAILDLSPAGHQPMVSADGRHILVYNGELYNFVEIREQMAVRGRRFRSRGDTEVALEALAEKGAAALDEFNGMFALALWDAREQRGLLARDAFGVKPLYYAPLSGGRLIFASEIKALLLHPDLAPGVNLAALQDYLAFLWTPDPRTLFEGIYKLPPGHLLEWQDGQYQVRRYYELPGPSSTPASELGDREAAEALRLHLRSAVRRQRVSDVPVGLFLSGGLDSSALLAEIAADPEGASDLRCYTAAFPGEDNAFDQFTDDLPYARAVAERFGARLTVFDIRAQVAELLPRLLYFADEPLADPAIINTYLICRQARQDGAIVLLSGQGADELLGGYRRHLAPLLNARLGRMPAPLRRAVARAARRLPAARPGQAGGALRRMRKMLTPLDRPPLEQFIQYCQWLTDEETNSLLHPDVVAALGNHRPSEETAQLLDQSPSPALLDRMLYRDLKTFLPALNLTYTDKMGMAASVEARVPYLDRELAEFAWRLPARQKIRGRTGKWLLREAMRGVLPEGVLRRPKTGFGAPVRQWMRRELREMAGDLLSPAALAASGLFSVTGVESLRARFERGEGDHGYSVWALLVFQLWREVFLRQPAARA
ncbi:MAG TPA: asparagine synthase (glutamine-hydrolyzing) [Bryobacterales bacterium]|nr:asparagine synthase (glutamine-hydrolyzing) [Bryobacterales bacterium]